MSQTQQLLTVAGEEELLWTSYLLQWPCPVVYTVAMSPDTRLRIENSGDEKSWNYWNGSEC